MVKQLVNKILGEKEERKKSKVKVAFGRSGRDSVINPNESNPLFNRNRIKEHPAVRSRFSTKDITVKSLEGKSDSEVINILIRKSDGIKFAVSTIIRYAIKDYELIGEDVDKVKIQDFIDEMEMKGKSFLTLLHRIAYGIVVEGAFCAELIFTEDGETPIKIEYVSPFSIATEKRVDSDIGEYYVYGQKTNRNQLNDLFDEANPNDTFRISPYLPNGDDPFGDSPLQGSLFSTVVLRNLLTTVSKFLEGQITPKEVFAPDIAALAQADFSPTQIEEFSESFVDQMKAILDSTDETEIPAISVPFIRILLGVLESANLDGIPIIRDSLERSEQISLNIPRVLYGARRGGSGLNDRESDIEWLSFDNMTTSIRNFEEANINPFFRVLGDHLGCEGRVRLKIIGEDKMIQKIVAECFDLQMQGFQKAKELAIFSRGELRRKAIELVPMFSDLRPDELPDWADLTVEGNPEPQQSESNTDSSSQSSTE